MRIKEDYIKCDVCNKTIEDDYRWYIHKFIKPIFGFRIKFTKFTDFTGLNTIDICEDCLHKIKKIKMELDLAQKIEDKMLNKFTQFDSPDCQAAYLTALDDMKKLLYSEEIKGINE